MKKTLPLIIILISFSLVGIVILEVSWFYNVKLVKEEQYRHRIEDAVRDVSNYLIDQKSSMTPGTNVLSFEFLKPTIGKKFSRIEVQDKIQAAFNNHGLHKVKFEFAITNFAMASRDEFEMYSPKFLNYFLDTAVNYHVFYHLSVASGSITESLVPDEELIVVVPDFMQYVWNDLQWILLGAILFTLIIFAAFYLTVSNMLKQRKLSEIKSDFINNMTHEFKTPLATISLAVDALKNDKVKSDPVRREYFTGIIKDENKRMNKHVETILQAALFDKQELKLALKPVKVNHLINKVLDNFRLQFEEKQVEVTLKLNASEDEIEADETHLENVLNNLVDNAVKYSKERLSLSIATMVVKKNIRIVIEDNGIGMNKETVSRIFEKFYRAHTGNVHNVKGFGLGLSYVKSIVDALHGKIKVESTLGKGTVFTLEFPLIKS
jgi:two-component system phosphate regulon sensor histidine kinase PhoR